MSRIVTVYSPQLRSIQPVEMGYISWYRMSAALASLGHSVDIASAELRRRVFRRIEMWRRTSASCRSQKCGGANTTP